MDENIIKLGERTTLARLDEAPNGELQRRQFARAG